MDALHNPTMRVIQILELTAEYQSGITLSEISKKLGLPKSTLVPILKTLKECGYLTMQETTARYRIGYQLFSIGSSFLQKFDIMDEVGRELEHLSELLKETCYFGILVKGNVLYLQKKEASRSLGILTTIGKTKPAYATGLGKALLIEKQEEELRNLYPNGLLPITEATICDVKQLAEQLKEQRKLGYCWEIEESMQHIRCFAVPIYQDKKIVGAISVAMPVFRYLESEKEEIITKLKEVKERIELRIRETGASFIKNE